MVLMVYINKRRSQGGIHANQQLIMLGILNILEENKLFCVTLHINETTKHTDLYWSFLGDLRLIHVPNKRLSL